MWINQAFSYSYDLELFCLFCLLVHSMYTYLTFFLIFQGLSKKNDG